MHAYTIDTKGSEIRYLFTFIFLLDNTSTTVFGSRMERKERNPQALEDITNITAGEDHVTRKLSFEEIKKRVRSMPAPPSISRQETNVELVYSPPGRSRGRGEKGQKNLKSKETNNGMNSNTDEVMNDNPPTSALSHRPSSSSSLRPLENQTNKISDLLLSLISIDKDDILRKVSGVRVIEYVPKNERVKYKKIAAAEYVNRVKQIVDNDIVNSESYENIVNEAERLGYNEMTELLRRIREEEQNNCLTDPLLFMKKFFCGLYS